MPAIFLGCTRGISVRAHLGCFFRIFFLGFRLVDVGVGIFKYRRARLHRNGRRRCVARGQGLQSLDAKLRRHQRFIGAEIDAKALPYLEFSQRLALVIEDEECDGRRYGDGDGSALLAGTFFVDGTQHVEGCRFRRTNMPGA
ncbi:MAG TPA: hypothetical protein VHQ39_12585, partial [Dongiaceae bacterium]|nr:hypothetical protein [Dongiaceae bacterium]